MQGTGAFGLGNGVADNFRNGAFTRANGTNVGLGGDAQVYEQIMRGSGTSGSFNLLATGSGGAAGTTIIRIRTGLPTSQKVRVDLQAFSSTGDTASWEAAFTITGTGTAASVKFVAADGSDTAPVWNKTAGTAGSSGWTPSLSKDTTNGGVVVNLTGAIASGKTVTAVANVKAIEVTSSASS